MTAFIITESYAIGWIAALPIERAAATAQLDSRHEAPVDFEQHPSDTNSYTWGRIGKHNVVIASLPAGVYGTTAAATTASNLLASLPAIKIGLLVGIGGGIPRQLDPDIRLGDVVVSQPEGTAGGVIQYDLGKARLNGIWEPKGILHKPPQVLLSALAALQAEHEIVPPKIPDILKEMIINMPRMRKPKRKEPGYVHQGFENDRLFSSTYGHIEGPTCDNCDPAKELQRDRRDTIDPEIHYGIIASGNTLVKDSSTRDKIAESAGSKCLCVETEAAGLMDHFPCLVIRGICDYADSHKNDRWQRYASATAAAYTKELLGHVPYKQLQHTEQVSERLRAVLEGVTRIENSIALYNATVLNSFTSSRGAFDSSRQHGDIVKMRQPGTGQWLLTCSKYLEWLKSPGRSLFCYGIPGAGKTILAATVIDHLVETFLDDPAVAVTYVYCKSKRQNEQDLCYLLISLVQELLQQSAKKHPAGLRNLGSALQNAPSSWRQVSHILKSTVELFSRVFIIIDALDECRSTDGCQTTLIQEVLSLQSEYGVNILITATRSQEFHERFPRNTTLQIFAHREDVKKYLSVRISQSNSAPLQLHREQVIVAITEIVDGMFLLAKLYFDNIATKKTSTDLINGLQQLQCGTRAYSHVYDNIMQRISEQDRDSATLGMTTLCWIAYAGRQLTTLELQQALAISPKKLVLDEENMPSMTDIVQTCLGLVMVDMDSGIIRLAHGTTQTYFDNFRDKWFPDAHTRLTITCITCLLFDADGIEFYNYAVNYWAYHCQLAASVPAKVRNFLSNKKRVLATWRAFTHRSERCLRALRPKGPHLATFFALDSVVEAFPATCLESRDGNGRTPLFWALEQGHQNIVDLLLDKGAKFEIRDLRGQTPLLVAIEKRNRTAIEQLLRNGASCEYGKEVKAVDLAGQKPIHYAVRSGSRAIVKLLLRHGAKQESRDKYGRTPLRVAVLRKDVDMVRFLLLTGADAESVDETLHETLLCHIAKVGNAKIAGVLLGGGAYVDGTDGIHGRTPLSYAAEWGHVAIAEILLENNACPESKDKHYGRTPLSYAVEWGHTDIIRLLLENGAWPGFTPMWYAIKSNRWDIVTTLRSYGADIDNVDRNGRTPLWRATAAGKFDTVSCLLQMGACSFGTHGVDNISPPSTVIYWVNHSGISILRLVGARPLTIHTGDCERSLSCAAARGNLELVQELLNEGENPNELDMHGLTPLWHAAANGHDGVARLLLQMNEGYTRRRSFLSPHPLIVAAKKRYKSMIQLLLKFGCSIDATDAKYGQTALSLAVERGDVRTVKLLLSMENCANIDAMDDFCRTSLVHASIWGHESIILQLLDHGADPNAADAQGRTPLLHAAKRGHRGCASLLLKHGADVEARDKSGKTALWYATMHNHGGVVSILLEYRAGDATLKSDKTLFWSAIRRGHTSFVRLMLEQYGSSVSEKKICKWRDGLGRTPLCCAVELRNWPLVQLLIWKGADLEARDNNGWTPLFHAVDNTDEGMARALLRNGANAGAMDNKGCTPLIYAREIEDEGLIKLLSEYSQAVGSSKTDLEKQIALVNRAFVNLRRGRFAAVLSDTTQMPDPTQPVMKALLRSGLAYYGVQNFAKYRETLLRLLASFPEEASAQAELARVEARLHEQATGQYSFASMHQQAKATSGLVDSARFYGPIEIRESPGRRRGLFLTNGVAVGDLILFEKASAFHRQPPLALQTLPAGITTMFVHDSIPSQTEKWNLSTQLQQKLRHNFESTRSLLDLFAGTGDVERNISTPDNGLAFDSFLVKSIVDFNATTCPTIIRGKRTESDEKHLTVVGDEDKGDTLPPGHGIWLKSSYINHSCYASCVRVFIGDTVIVRAARNLPAGSEITVAYAPPEDFESPLQAGHRLRPWGLTCTCELCAARGQRPFTRDILNTLRHISKTTPETVLSVCGKLDAKYPDYAGPDRTPCVEMWQLLPSRQKALKALNKGPMAAIDAIAATLCSLGFETSHSREHFEIKQWGMMLPKLPGVLAELHDTYATAHAPACPLIKKYTRLAFLTMNGEDETFGKSFPKLAAE